MQRDLQVLIRWCVASVAWGAIVGAVVGVAGLVWEGGVD